MGFCGLNHCLSILVRVAFSYWGVTKKKGEIIYGVWKSLTLGIQTQYDLLKFSETEKRLLQMLFLHLNPYRHQTLLF